MWQDKALVALSLIPSPALGMGDDSKICRISVKGKPGKLKQASGDVIKMQPIWCNVGGGKTGAPFVISRGLKDPIVSISWLIGIFRHKVFGFGGFDFMGR